MSQLAPMPQDGSTRGRPLLMDAQARDQLCQAVRTLDAAERHGHPLPMSQALVQVARCLAALGALEDAESHLEQALRWSRALATMDIAVELMCECAETACATADAADAEESRRGNAARERARDHAFEAASMAAQVSDPQWEVKVLLRVSDVLDRCGDHDDAVSMQTRALLLMNLQPAGADTRGDALHCPSPQHLM
ncbi:MAG: hypothetical protein ACKVQR_08745 [Aquabacterium sp.]